MPLTETREHAGNMVLTISGGLVAIFFAGNAAIGVWSWLATLTSFRSGASSVNWSEGTDLIVFLAPLITALVIWLTRRSQLWRWPRAIWSAAFLLFILGLAIVKGASLSLDYIGAAYGYHACAGSNVIDAYGSRGGGPALISWGYNRQGCSDK